MKIMAPFYRFILLALTGVLLTLSSYAVDERYSAVPLAGNRLRKDSSNIVKDSVYFDPALRPTQVTYKVRNLVTFKINEFANLKLPASFAATITLKVYYVRDQGGVEKLDSTSLLTMRVDYGSGPYQHKAIQTFIGGYQAQVKLFSVTVDNASLADVEASLMVENEILVTRDYQFNCTNHAVTALHTPNFSDTKGELGVSWTPQRVADEYDLEWTYIDSAAEANYYQTGNTNFDAGKVFRNNASRVSLKQSSYFIPLLYDGKGKLVYRVRAVQVKVNGQRLESSWSSDFTNGLGTYAFNGHERLLNWQASTSFAEDGKRKSVVQYFDGSMRNRQSVTKDNTTDTTVVAETFYDYQGRAAIQVMPTPSLSSLIQYTPRFNATINGAEYDKTLYDGELADSCYCKEGAPAMSNDSGAARYYSPNNPLSNTGIHQYIPDAKGFPFSETRYTPDNTGRIGIQSGVGAEFQIDSGRATRYYYSAADQEELDVLFGTEVGNASHYFKNMVRDANGQYSVSYVDMHGRTIATALAGRPATKMDTLESAKRYVITKKLLDSNTNVVKGYSIESVKGLIVTRADSLRFRYSLLNDSILIKSATQQNVCYDCTYDLEIRITDDCNNATLPGGVPIVITATNDTAAIECGSAPSFPSVDRRIYLREGNYTVTKTLTISQKGLERFRAAYIQTNLTKTMNQFIVEQKQALNITCQPSCTSCLTTLGSWESFRANYMQQMGIPVADSGSYRQQATVAYRALREECDLLCNPKPLDENIYEQMLADVTPPFGQYATKEGDAHLIDSFSIFKQDPTFRFKTVSGYVDEDGKADGTPYQLNSADAFIAAFKPSWAQTLLYLHPEYEKYARYADFRASHQWDERFANTETFQAAVDSGYLNPGNFSGLPNTAIFTYKPAYADPLMTTNLLPYAKNVLQQALLQQVPLDGGGYMSAWALATAMAHCTNGDATCQQNYTNISTAFTLDAACSGELDIAWRYFREMYLQAKRRIIDDELVEYVFYLGREQVFYDELTIAGHTLNFPHGSPQSAPPVVSTNPATATANANAAITQYVNQNCALYANQWLEELKPCGLTEGQKTTILNRLIQVCQEGGDMDHVFGASTVKPSSTHTDRSFEQVLKDVLGSNYNSACNVYLISAPLPYAQQPVLYDKPVFTKPDSCQCATIGNLYQQHQQAGVDVNFSDYLFRTSGTRIYQGVLDTLRMSCSGELNCQFLKEPLSLPPVLQCGAGNRPLNVCATCVGVDTLYTQFQAEFPGVTPSYNNTDSLPRVHNRLFEQFMNTHLGFAKPANEYLDFMSACSPTGDVYCNVALGFGGTVAKKRVTIPVSNNRLQLGTGNFTFEARIKPKTNPTFNAILTNRVTSSSTEADGFMWIVVNGQLLLQLQGCYNYQTSNTAGINLYDGLPHHVAVSRNGDSLGFYIDGIKVPYFIDCTWGTTKTPPSQRNITTAGPYYIGLDTTGAAPNPLVGYNGWMDEVRIWNVARTPQQIADNRNLPLTPQANLVGYYLLRSKDTCTQLVMDLSSTDPLLRNNGYLGVSPGKDAWDPTWLSAAQVSYAGADPTGILNGCGCNGPVLCGQTESVFQPAPLRQHSPCDDSTFLVFSKATLLYEAYRDSAINLFNDRYLAKCLGARFRETFTVEQPISEYHYTLYYYDQAGNLVKTVPPAGVDLSKFSWATNYSDSVRKAQRNKQVLKPAHQLPTDYRYNTLNQVVAQKSPDGGTSRFWYDRLGRLAVSQNANQQAAGSANDEDRLYSYTQYDSLGRITEVGQMKNTAANGVMSNALSRDTGQLKSWLLALTNRREQVTQTIYDQPYYDFVNAGDYRQIVAQRNLRNRVSYVSYTDVPGVTGSYNNASFYSYDILGNVDTLLQDYGPSVSRPNMMNKNANRYKKLVYQYDLVSGKVNMVQYQPGWEDRWIHRYSYDAENRLTLVETSNDSLVWEKDARYEYYRHGPLARTVLGEQLVQGIDYAYTLQGWLKGINSTKTIAAHDMGKDGLATGVNKYVARDALGLNLNYFNGDYKAINSGVTPFPQYVGLTTGGLPNNEYRPLYNGNISSAANTIRKLGEYTYLYNYRYDQLNRLTGQDAWVDGNMVTNNLNGATAVISFRERVSYDPNGNILRYTRNNAGTYQSEMDNLRYFYYPGTNRLKHVTDTIPDTKYGSSIYEVVQDIDSQPDSNYVYDAIGNLVQNKKEKITSIKWNVYGKITEINRDAQTDEKRPTYWLRYQYDAAGNRIGKTEKWLNKAPATPVMTLSFTWYVRDAQGNLISTYAANTTDMTALDTLQKLQVFFNDYQVYGSSRLGSYSNGFNVDNGPIDRTVYTNYATAFSRGWRQYELTNHLGNVLTTISDKKNGVSSGPVGSLIDYYEPELVNAQDYFPFGMVSRLNAGASHYRFGFNGQEMSNEISGYGGSYTAQFWEYDPRIGRRWNLDPRPTFGVSGYSALGNNPILLNDILGDTATNPTPWMPRHPIETVSDVGYIPYNLIGSLVNRVQSTISKGGEYVRATTDAGLFVGLNTQIGKDFNSLTGFIAGEFNYFWETPGEKIAANAKGFYSNPDNYFRAVEDISGPVLLTKLPSLNVSNSFSLKNATSKPLNISEGNTSTTGELAGNSTNILSSQEMLRIKNAASRIGRPITVVGSRASGKAGAYSDWDYVIPKLTNSEWKKIKNSLPGSKSVLDNTPRKIDIFNEPVNTTKPHIIIKPR